MPAKKPLHKSKKPGGHEIHPENHHRHETKPDNHGHERHPEDHHLQETTPNNHGHEIHPDNHHRHETKPDKHGHEIHPDNHHRHETKPDKIGLEKLTDGNRHDQLQNRKEGHGGDQVHKFKEDHHHSHDAHQNHHKTHYDSIQNEKKEPTILQQQNKDDQKEETIPVKPVIKQSVLTAIVNIIPSGLRNLFGAKEVVQKPKETKQNSEPKAKRKRHRKAKRVTFEIAPIKLPPLIKFFYKFAEFWEWCSCVLAVISFGFITFVSVFSFYQSELFVVVFYIDVIFLIDTNIRVVVEIWRYKTGVPYIVFVTPYTFLQYIADMISLFPFERFYTYTVGSDDLRYLEYFDFFRYNRFIRFWRGYTFLRVAVKEGRVSENLSFILRYATMYTALIHLVACIFFSILPVTSMDILLQRNHRELDKYWIKDLWKKKPMFGLYSIDQYMLSLSFATSVVTTTGYGDMSARRTEEMFITIIWMLLGAIILSGMFTSGLTNFKLNHDGSRFDLFFRVQAIQENLSYIGTHQLFREKVNEYYNLLWNYREGVYDVQTLHQLPNSMQSDVLYDICQEMFHKSQLFRNLDESFLRTVSRVVKVVLYNPDMILCARGGYAISMLYIIQGEINVKSKLDSNVVGAVLRAGCIIGEMNLLFSFPYTTTLETRTSCQLLMIEKSDFLKILEHYTSTFEIVRQRIETRIHELRERYEIIGTNPACWVEYRGDLLTSGQRRTNEFPVIMRRGTGFNSIVTDDVVDDTSGYIIIDMPCLNPKFEKDHNLVYKNCLVPPILKSKDKWVQTWVKFILIRTLYGAFMGPYCQAFRHTSTFEEAVCGLDSILKFPCLLINIVDLLVEIACCVPVVGLYYKFTNGIRIKLSQISFWIDVASCIPWDIFERNEGTGFWFYSVVAIIRACKLWKIIRYFNFLDNKYPMNLFSVRLLQTLVAILCAMHFLACILFATACWDGLEFDNPPICPTKSWLRSYEILSDYPDREVQVDFLAEEMPYLISFYFSCVTLSSAGFGDFNPQTMIEMGVLVLAQLIGFGLIGQYTALLTSALSCIVRPKLLFQQKLVAIRQFMDHHGINEILQYRVIEHYTLQNQLLAGVNLPRTISHFMYDAPDYLLEDALYQDVSLLFDGVPILSKLDVKSVVNITKLMRRYLIPPGSIFLRRGEVRRQMYLIARGSVGVMSDHQDRPVRVLESTGHFGLRDILFGEPAHYHIKTLSYCLLYEIERQDLISMLEEETETNNIIELEKHKVQAEINRMTSDYSRYRLQVFENPKTTSSWIRFPKNNTNNMVHCSFYEYEELFENLRFHKAYRFVLMRKAVHPAGIFAKLWLSAISLLSWLTLTTLVTQSFMELRSPWFRTFQVVLDCMNYLDIYVRIHWAYYDKRNVLVCHPLMTMMNYVFDGPFIFDLLFCTPFELIIPILESSNIYGYSISVFWYSKLCWTRLGQIIRVPAVVQVCHNIFRMRNLVLLLLYIVVTLVICTAVTAVSSHLSCPSRPHIFRKGDQNFLPFCPSGSWAFKKSDLLDNVLDRWIYGIYYVSQVIFAIGFGDMISLNKSELLLLIVLLVFGYILAICVLADITAAEVDVDEARAAYLESMKCLNLIMAREKVHWRLVQSVTEHLKHNWITSKGLQPRQLFYDLHPALEADMFREFVGDLLKKVPIFSNITENIVRAICQYMKKLYFLKGEHLMRCGNLEYEMYIIVEGKVWITDHNKEWFTTLRKGESFGEAAMIHGHRRKFSAIASSLVEVFVLTANDFAAVLESYPKLEEEISEKLKGGRDEDLFEKILKSSKKKKAKEEKYILRRPLFTQEIHHVLEIKDHPDLEEVSTSASTEESHLRRFQKNFIGYGHDDENLPFIYFATKKVGFNLLIHPDCAFMKYFSSIIVWICFITPCLGVYEIAFSNFSELTPDDPLEIGRIVQEVTTYLEFPIYLHIIFEFITPFILFEGIYCKAFKGIAFNYATSPTRFPIDIISAFPVPLLEPYVSDEDYRNYVRWLFLLRLFRLIHFYRAQFAQKDDLSTSAFVYKITISFSYFILMCHFLACFFYGSSPCLCRNPCFRTAETDWTHKLVSEMCKSRTWTRSFVEDNDISEIQQMTPWRWYIRALYFVVTTVTTTGFGDITAQNLTETVIATICIFCGAFVLSVILSQFTSGAATLGQAHREYFYRVNLLSKYLSNIGLSRDRKYLLNAYFLMTWEASRGVNYHDATDILPLTMKIEVCHSLYFEIMKKCKLFYHIKDKTFLRQVAVRFTHSMYLTGTNIVNEGEQGTRLFIVFKGCVFGHTDKDGRVELKKMYNPGQVFGRLPSLFYDMPYTKTYRSEIHTEVLSLDQEDILHLIKFFPEFKKLLQLFVLRKYDRRTTTETIFQLKSVKKGLYDLDVKAMSGGGAPGSRPKTAEHYLEEYRTYRAALESGHSRKSTKDKSRTSRKEKRSRFKSRSKPQSSNRSTLASMGSP